MNSSNTNRKKVHVLKLSVFVLTIVASICYAGFPVAGSTNYGGAYNYSFSASLAGAGAGALFQQRCAKCHGTDGRGDTPSGRALGAPDFTDENWRSGHSESERKLVIASGKKGM